MNPALLSRKTLSKLPMLSNFPFAPLQNVADEAFLPGGWGGGSRNGRRPSWGEYLLAGRCTPKPAPPSLPFGRKAGCIFSKESLSFMSLGRNSSLLWALKSLVPTT